jgi:diadenosine tetraphosphatase ApaH/serine/threonine PP2A family protein phosphatase
MRLALLSDIHANLQALDACLEHAQNQGADRFAVLGDLVGYGADPVAVVQRIQALQADGALVIKGNHDAMVANPPATVTSVGESTAQWTRDQLSDADRFFLQQLPLTQQLQNILLVHGSADDPERWRYVTDERAAGASLDACAEQAHIRYMFVGHVHFQTLYYRGSGTSLMRFTPTAGVAVPVPKHRHWLATIGSVGQPRDGNPQAMYAIMDTDKLQLTFYRVSYDHHSAAGAIRRAGLPAFFADRLETGR